MAVANPIFAHSQLSSLVCFLIHLQMIAVSHTCMRANTYFYIVCLLDFKFRLFSFIFYQFKFVDPLLRSPIVGDVAYETMVKLSRCIVAPLCNWALDIATALRLIATAEVRVQFDLISSSGEGEENERPSLGLFERIVSGLSVSCKSGALPVDSFTFVFPVSFCVLFLFLYSFNKIFRFLSKEKNPFV